MAKLFNRAKMTTSTTGSGTVTLSAAAGGFQSFADAGVSDGDVVQYLIEEGSAWEIGTGTYSSTGTSLTRTPSESSDGGTAITLGGTANVAITAVADDLNRLQHEGSTKVSVSATGASVTGALTTSGDLTVNGEVAADLSFGDNTKAKFGASDDLQIFHDGADSAIKDVGTGNLYIQSNGAQILLQPVAGEQGIIANANGDVSLYYDNSLKLSTTSYGTFFTGNSKWGDSDKVVLGDGDDLQLYHDGFNSVISDIGTGALLIYGSDIVFQKNGSSERMADMAQDGAVRLFHDGSVRIETTSVGALIKGNAGSTSIGFGYNENGGELTLHDETGNVATLLDQAVNNTRLLELQNGSGMQLGLGGTNTTGSIAIMSGGFQEAIVIDSSGNTFARKNMEIGHSDTTSEYQGLSLKNGKDSSAAQTTSYIDVKNNLGYPDSHIFFKHNTDGSSGMVFGVTTAGSRSTDRRQTAMTLNSSGNLGIGSTNPTSKLTLGGDTIQYATALLISETGHATSERAGIQTGGWIFGQDSAGSGTKDFFIYDGNTSQSRFKIATSGELFSYQSNTTSAPTTFGSATGQIFRNENSEFAFGLLNASPYPLYIQGRNSVNAARDIVLQPSGGRIGIGTSAPSKELELGALDVFRLQTGSVTLDCTPTAGATDSFVWNTSADAIYRWDMNGTERMRLDSGGRVGIGTSAPTGNLTVYENITSVPNYYDGLQVEVRATSGTAGISLHRAGYSHVGIYHDTYDRLSFNMSSGTVHVHHDAGTLYGTGNSQASMAWGNLNGIGTISLRDSYNVSSVTDGGTGIYTFNLSSSMSDANYGLQLSCGGTFNVDAQINANPTASAISVTTRYSSSDSLHERDVAYVTMNTFGELA